MKNRDKILTLIIAAAILFVLFQIILISPPVPPLCKNNIDKELEKFILNLHNAADYRADSNFSLKLDKCFNENNATIGIQTERDSPNSPANCNAVCGIHSGRCHIMVFYAPDIPNGLVRKCINIADYAVFETDASMCPPIIEDLAEYNAIQPELSKLDSNSQNVVSIGQPRIKSGNYILKNISLPGEETPRICIYYAP
jgi:hypothetical protein